MWGEMTGTAFANTLPAAYRAHYDETELLRDSPAPSVDQSLIKAAAQHALECVDFLRSEVPVLG